MQGKSFYRQSFLVRCQNRNVLHIVWKTLDDKNRQEWVFSMAIQKRKRTSAGKRWSYFYLNGELHKTLETRRSDNLLVAWSYPQKKRVAYALNDAYRRRQRAYSSAQVCKILNKHVDTLKRHLREGNIRKPQAAYSLDGTKKLVRYLFSEDDIREIHEFFRTVHIGRPRLDGTVNTSNLISGPELEALLRNERILYTKNEDGDFIPVWKQPEW